MLLAAARYLVERRLGDIYVSALDQRRHVAEKERQEQRAYVRTVDVRVGHDDDPLIAQLLCVEVLFLAPDAASQRRNQCGDLVGRQHLVQPGFFHVENLSAQRQDRLRATIARLFGGTAGRIALDQENFALARIFFLAIGQLPGQAAHIALLASNVAGLAGRLARRRRVDDLLRNRPGLLRVLKQELPQAFGYRALNRRLGFRRDQPFLGLRGKLGIPHLHGNDGCQPFAHVFAPKRQVLGAIAAVMLQVGIESAGEGRAKALLVRPAVVLRNVVGKERTVLLVSRIPLHRRLDLHLGGSLPVLAVSISFLPARDLDDLRSFHVKHLRMQGFAGLIQPLHEFTDSAFGVKGPLTSAFALVRKLNRNAAVEEGQFPQPVRQRVGVKLEAGGENLRIRAKADDGSAAIALAGVLQRPVRNAGRITLAVLPATPVNQQFQVRGQKIDHRNANTVEAARHLVHAFVEFAACVQRRHDQFRCGTARLGMLVHRDSTAVVADLRPAIREQADRNFRAVSGQGFVDGVVDNLVDQVMQAGAIVRVADIHAWQFANRLAVLQHFDLVRAVGLRAVPLGWAHGRGAIFGGFLHCHGLEKSSLTRLPGRSCQRSSPGIDAFRGHRMTLEP